MSVPSDLTAPSGGAPRAAARSRGRGLLRLVAVVTAMAAAAGLGGSVSYSAVQSLDKDPCSPSRCLPKVDVAPVKADLAAHGFTCRQADGQAQWHDCDYLPARGRFQVSFLNGTSPGYLQAFRIGAYRAKGYPASEMDMNFMVWATSRLFVGTAEQWTQIEAWLRARVSENKKSTAVIGAYQFDFEPNEGDGHISLYVGQVWK